MERPALGRVGELPDLFAMEDIQAWLAAVAPTARLLGQRLGVRHFTTLQRVKTRSVQFVEPLARRLVSELGLSGLEARYLYTLVELDAVPTPDPRWPSLRAWLDTLPPTADAVLVGRLRRGEELRLEAVAARLAEASGAEMAERAAVAALAERERVGWELDRLRALARAARGGGRVDPSHEEHRHVLDGVGRGILAISEDPAMGTRAWLGGVHQGCTEAGLQRLQANLAELAREMVGRTVKGDAFTEDVRRFLFSTGFVQLTRPFGACAPPLPVSPTRLPGPDLAERAAEHHAKFLAAAWPELEERARERPDIAKRHPTGPLPLTAVVAWCRGLGLGDPRVESERSRWSRLRSGDTARSLQPEEIAWISAALDLDPGLLALVARRDAGEPVGDLLASELVAIRNRRHPAEALLGAWYTAVLVELAACSGSAIDPEWVARVVWPRIPMDEIPGVLAGMKARRLFACDEGGRISGVSSHGIAALRPPGVSVHAPLIRGHVLMLERVRAFLDASDPPPFTLHSLELRLPPAAVSTIRRRLVATVRGFMADAEAERGRWDRVVQLHTWLVPRS